MRDFDPEVAPTNVNLLQDKDQVEIEWCDGHRSVLHEDWLIKREFTGDQYSERKLLAKGPPKKLWGAENEPKKHNFTDILNDDQKLFDWLKDVQVYGITVVDGMPNVFGSLQVLRDRVGCRRLTHYGDGFHVVTKPNANDLAYTGRGLGLHTDHPYYEYSPGIQFLHCMSADTIGGENEFADAFKVADMMQKNFFEEWKLLAQTKVEFQNIGEDASFGVFNKAKISPIFQYDETGDLHTVRFSNQARGSYLTTLTPEQVLPFYRALKHFNDLCYHKDQMVIHRLNPGECVVFDNLRVLHGRKDFTVNAGGTRQLHGGYMDWDEIRSKFNSLYKSLQLKCCNDEHHHTMHACQN